MYGGQIVVLLVVLSYAALIVVSLSQIFRSHIPENNKILWVIAILIAPFLGSLVWLAFGNRNQLS
ncbi:hypothetical protein JF66_11890 [Cryobacterium sp. MLB-32]|nr:hypothetical protein JF66_11890 [Cryobacterium sp. MLB-32]